MEKRITNPGPKTGVLSYGSIRRRWNCSCGIRRPLLLTTGMILVIFVLVGCGSCTWNLDIVDHTPRAGGDWEVSTPKEQGLDPTLVARLYFDAAKLETLYGLLVIRNGFLVGEAYFNAGSIDQTSGRQSVTKSVTSALVGIALKQGRLSDIDASMIDFFPELASELTDPRKDQITIHHLLQMRGGYPDEERETIYLDQLFFSGNWHWIPHIADFPLVADPGSEFNYSNLTSHILGLTVARATGTNLLTFARENLFSPLNAEVPRWTGDADGYAWGWGELNVTARDMAKLGLLYLNRGEYDGKRVLSADWVDASLRDHTEHIIRGGNWRSRYGDFWDIGYGYQWWSARVGDHRFNYACGHGGNYIILLRDLRMIIVTTADPLYGPDLAGAGGWKYEGAINKVVARFIRSLPET